MPGGPQINVTSLPCETFTASNCSSFKSFNELLSNIGSAFEISISLYKKHLLIVSRLIADALPLEKSS